MRFVGLLLGALVAVSGWGVVSAEHLGPEDVNALHLNVLVYHPLPDEQGDPWGVPAVLVNGTWRDWMSAYFGAFFYPTAAFDGVILLDRVPQVEGGGAFESTAAAYRRAYAERVGVSSPLRVTVQGQASEGRLDVRGNVSVPGLAPEGPLSLRVVLFEDDVLYNGGNGILNHRSVVRAIRFVGDVEPSPGVPVGYSTSFELSPFWAESRLGVVVIVQNAREDVRDAEFREVLQSATWRVGQSGPTVQQARGVLLELYSATWCDACVVGDTVADDMANEFGLASARVTDRRFDYLRPGPWWTLVGALVLGAALVAWLAAPGRRGPAGGGGSGSA